MEILSALSMALKLLSMHADFKLPLDIDFCRDCHFWSFEPDNIASIIIDLIAPPTATNACSSGGKFKSSLRSLQVIRIEGLAILYVHYVKADANIYIYTSKFFCKVRKGSWRRVRLRRYGRHSGRDRM